VVIKSLPVVAMLRIHGIEPQHTGKDGAGRCTFIYQRTEQVNGLLNDFYGGTLAVPAKPFADAIYQVKKDFMPR